MAEILERRREELKRQQKLLELEATSQRMLDERFNSRPASGGDVGGSSARLRPSSAPSRKPKEPAGQEETIRQNAEPPLTSRASLLTRYFNAMSDFPDYAKRRKQRLSAVQPFSFDLRECVKEKTTARRRFDEENERREAEVQAMLHNHFKANPVPPSTFIHKYEVMVQEWCARKSRSQQLAQEKARQLQAEAWPAKRYAEAFQKTKADTYIARRAASLEAERERRFRKDFKARDVPLHVKLPMWEQLAVQEHERGARIRRRAEKLLAVSSRPPRMEQAEQLRSIHQEVLQIKGRSEDAQVPQVDTTQKPSAESGLGPKRARSQNIRDIEDLQKRNPNLTFAPTLHTTVPDYEYLWARDRVEMLKRKQDRPPTVVKTFNLHEVKQDPVARIAMDMKRDEATLKENRWPYKSTRAKVRPTPPPKREAVSPPKGTHAQELKADCAFKRILAEADARNREAQEKAERAKKQRDVNSRLAPFLAQQRQNEGPTLQQRVAEKKKQLRLANAEAKHKLKNLREKVHNEPPLFMEPAHLDVVAKARAATEEQVLQMLKAHGLAERTLNAIMTTVDVSAIDIAPAPQRVDGTVRNAAEETSLVTATNNLTQQRRPEEDTPTAASQPPQAALAATQSPASVPTTTQAAKKKKERGSSSSGSSSSYSSSDSSSDSA